MAGDTAGLPEGNIRDGGEMSEIQAVGITAWLFVAAIIAMLVCMARR